MTKHLTYELLKNFWLIDADHIEMYAQIAKDVLLGRTIDTSLFGSLELPSVPDNMALVAMVGALAKSDICNAQGTRSLSNQVQAAASNPKIDAIILLSENCPGGTVAGTEEFANTIKAAAGKKPVVGVVSDMACSAAVWALAGCSEIYSTSATAMVGCIGAMARMKNPKNADAENGDYIEVISAVTPDKNSESRDMQQLQERYMIPVAKLFQNAVMQGRGDRLKLSKEDVLTGKTYVAQHAQEYGLIDGIMPMNKIVARANFLSKKQNTK